MVRRLVPPALVMCLLLIVPGASPALAAGDSQTSASAPSEGWVTLMAEDFEGAFPSAGWHIGRSGDPYLWGQRDCNPHTGRYSMWGGAGGTLGSQIPCMGMYTTGFATTLSYGPFDLSGCSGVRLNFAHWTWLGAGDSLGVGYSTDGGTVWHLVPITGNAVSVCDGWCEESFGQDRWPIPLCGQPKVYLLFRFASNATDVSYGAFVDDVSLEAYYGAPPDTATPTPSPTPTPSATYTATATPPRTATFTPTGIPLRPVYLPMVLR